MPKIWKPSMNNEIFNDDDRIQFGILNSHKMQSFSTLTKVVISDHITIKGLSGGVADGTIIGFNNFTQKGRIIYFESEVGYYGAIDIITDGQNIISIENIYGDICKNH